jgi:citrate synthase
MVRTGVERMTAWVNGLDGVVVADTALSRVDGSGGALLYRGRPADQLAETASFGEVAHLLWTGRLPEPAERAALDHALTLARHVPPALARALDAMPVELSAMAGLRTAVSLLEPEHVWPPTVDQAIRLVGIAPSILAYREARRRGRALPPPRDDLSPAAHYLYLLTGQPPDPARASALEAYWILAMEHGLNASTFAARVAASTESGLTAAVTAALAAMQGRLHGGAPALVGAMLRQIGTADRAEAWLREELAKGRRIMGFGHRIYRAPDPRAQALKHRLETLCPQDPVVALALAVEAVAARVLREVKPDRPLYPNVEYWAAVTLQAVGIPDHLFTATFSAARLVGWAAHILEQAPVNRLIRPDSRYVGPVPE